MEANVRTQQTQSIYHYKKTFLSLALTVMVTVLMVGINPPAAQANTAPINVGALANVSIFSDDAMCNSSSSTIKGDVAVDTDPSLLGISLPLGITISGAVNVANAVSAKVKVDVNAAINAIRARGGKIALGADVTGKVITPGAYTLAALKLNGTVTLDGKGDPNAFFILYVKGNLNIGAGSVMKLINKANSAKVLVLVEGAATIGARATIVGKLLSVGNITANANVKVYGSLLSQNGLVCLNADVVTNTPIVGADVEVAVTSPPVVPQEVTTAPGTIGGGSGTDDGATPDDTDNPTVNGTSVNGNAEALGDSVVSGSSPQTKTSSGVLAFTGRNALGLTTAALAFLAIGEGIYLFVMRRKMNPTL